MTSIPFLTDMKHDTFGLENFGELFRQHFHRVEHRPDGKYLFFCQTDTIFTLDPNSPWVKNSGKDYILKRLTPDLVDDLRNERASLVLDISGEGEKFCSKSFDAIHSWSSANRIPLARICIISQNRALSQDYKNFYKSDGILIVVYDWYISTFAALLAQPEPFFSERFGFDKDYRNPELATELFLCMNATPRPLRLSVLAALLQSGLLDRTIWSLMKEASGKYAGESVLLDEFLYSIGRYDLISFCQRINGMQPRILGTRPVINSNELAFDINFSSYDSTLFSIVTETDFTDGSVIRVTEKVIKPLAMGHPFIVFGNPQSLSIIRSFGFETFGNIFDESYDTATPPSDRFLSIMNELLKISRFTDSKLSSLAEIGKYNVKHARSGGMMRAYRDVVERPLIQQLELLAVG